MRWLAGVGALAVGISSGCFVSVPDVITDGDGGAASGGAGGEGGSNGGSASVCDVIGVDLTADNQPSEDEKVWHLKQITRRSTSLEIPPGTTVCATAGSALVIDAFANAGIQLNAVGTTTQPIVFTSLDGAAWKGVYLVGDGRDDGGPTDFTDIGVRFGGGAGQANVGSLQYARLENGGLHLGAPNEGTINNISVVTPSGNCYDVFGGGEPMSYLACTSPAMFGWNIASGIELSNLALRGDSTSGSHGIKVADGARADVANATLCGTNVGGVDALAFGGSSNVVLRTTLVKDMARFASFCPPSSNSGLPRDVTMDVEMDFDPSCGTNVVQDTIAIACDSFAAMVPTENIEAEQMPLYQGAFDAGEGDWTAGWALP